MCICMLGKFYSSEMDECPKGAAEAGDEDEDEGEEVMWQVRPTHMLYRVNAH